MLNVINIKKKSRQSVYSRALCRSQMARQTEIKKHFNFVRNCKKYVFSTSRIIATIKRKNSVKKMQNFALISSRTGTFY